MNDASRLDFGALLPHVGVFGGVRRFLAIGNALVRRGHRYVLYHPEGNPPDWLPFAGETRPLAALSDATHRVLLCGEPSLVPQFEAATAALKLFYCVLERMPDERRIVRQPGWVLLANSSGIRDRLRRKYGVQVEDAIGGVDLEQFHPGDRPRPDRPEPIRVLAYGRTSRPRKGTRLVVRSVESLSRGLGRRWPAWAGTLAHPVQLVLFDHLGAGNETDPRAELQTRLPVEFHVGLGQAQLAALYRSCDLFVSAERRAGWNNTVAEAMACGTAVVCTTSGTRDLARHAETAWVVPLRHPWFLARGLRALVRDPEMRRRLRTNAAGRMTRFTWDGVAERIEGVCRSHLRKFD